MYSRRQFLKNAALGMSALYAGSARMAFADEPNPKPNLLFIFADQWRAQDFGYAGNQYVATPRLDQFAAQSVNYSNAVSTCPVCCPYRASLMTGQYPLTNGVFLNDLQMKADSVSFAQAYSGAIYMTGFIGKWHLDGNGRSTYIPTGRRQGFQYFKALECTHEYNNSKYYAGNNSTQLTWPGYDASAQKDDAIAYLNRRAADKSPFALFLAWGPPHDPYRTGPTNLLSKYDAMPFPLRPNVPSGSASAARTNIAGYYAHCEALDTYFGQIMDTLTATGLAANTVVVFTSDHGDMLYSQGQVKKQKPWDESIRIPMLIRCPGNTPKTIDAPMGTPDIMPTVLGLTNIPVPFTCEGLDLSGEVLGTVPPPEDRAALITCPSPFGEWPVSQGWEYRGIRTKRYTYVRGFVTASRLLYDNQTDPYQMTNLYNNPAYADIQADLEMRLIKLLCQTGDKFQTRPQLIARTGYRVDSTGTIPYQNSSYWGQLSVACHDRNPFNASGPEGVPDCMVDEHDLPAFADEWLQPPNFDGMNTLGDLSKAWLDNFLE
jgi:arylsulfatase A-like enzyme